MYLKTGSLENTDDSDVMSHISIHGTINRNERVKPWLGEKEKNDADLFNPGLIVVMQFLL